MYIHSYDNEHSVFTKLLYPSYISPTALALINQTIRRVQFTMLHCSLQHTTQCIESVHFLLTMYTSICTFLPAIKFAMEMRNGIIIL